MSVGPMNKDLRIFTGSEDLGRQTRLQNLRVCTEVGQVGWAACECETRFTWFERAATALGHGIHSSSRMPWTC